MSYIFISIRKNLEFNLGSYDYDLDDMESQGLVLVIDDEAPLRSSLRNLLSSVGFEVALFDSCADFLSFELPDVPSCILLDVRLKGPSGLDLQGRLIEKGVDVPIIFMTAYGDIAMTVMAMKAGAQDFLCKPIRDQDLLDAVNTALQSHRTIRSERRSLEEVKRSYETLTPREREVMQHAASGLANKEIASTVGISEITVKIHRANAMRKMKADSFAQLVVKAKQLGLC